MGGPLYARAVLPHRHAGARSAVWPSGGFVGMCCARWARIHLSVAYMQGQKHGAAQQQTECRSKGAAVDPPAAPAARRATAARCLLLAAADGRDDGQLISRLQLLLLVRRQILLVEAKHKAALQLL